MLGCFGNLLLAHFVTNLNRCNRGWSSLYVDTLTIVQCLGRHEFFNRVRVNLVVCRCWRVVYQQKQCASLFVARVRFRHFRKL